MLKKIMVLLGVALVFFYIGRNSEQNLTQHTEPTASSQTSTVQNSAQLASAAKQSELIAHAFDNQLSDVPVQGNGLVIRELSDDNNGSRHQRILLQLPDDLTILIAHNIDLAPRVDNLKAGDSIEFKGEYAWNSKGGVVHWTHHDPNGRHPGGWLKHQNRTYQ